MVCLREGSDPFDLVGPQQQANGENGREGEASPG